MNKFQIAYILIFFISLIGICGNIELEIPTAFHCWVILIASGFLTLGKIIYLERRKKMKTRVELRKLTDSEKLMIRALQQGQIDSLVINNNEYTIDEIEFI